MRKTRLYLDTSPIIMIEPDQDPIRRAITQEFFRIVAENPGEYELFISPVTRDDFKRSRTLSERNRFDAFRSGKNLAHDFPAKALLHLTGTSHLIFSNGNTFPKN